MQLQQKILRDYRKCFPHDTLKEMNQRTGIQMSRIFRIMNGLEMKVTEYENIQQAISQEKMGKRNYHRVHTICRYLAQEENQAKLNEIFSFLDYQMELYRIDKQNKPNNDCNLFNEGA
jgi:GTP cyclohydrolase FolE2